MVRRRAGGCRGSVTANGRTIVTPATYLGDNVHFNGLRVMGRGVVTIGDNFHSGAECVIISETHNYEGDALPYDSTFIARDVEIGPNVWLGHHVTVLGGVSIGEGAIIQAGSVVAQSIPPYAIAGGHPAKPFATRDVEHYGRLKREGRFH
jgi:acetyltransferase-like isoleucine patch superfamily enzyme